ncbi:unnamed protein product [Toxocara canis]|uniref:Gnk2-homologous domain-containing protein n=1 Tax=Toxocara canis TaxID=6265 RepID=A0A183UMP5_TOXCA|nr:unnamed protein product [Toxocara canis]
MESSELLSGWLIIISIQTHYVTTNHINMSTSDFYLIRTSEPFHFTSSINFTSPLFDSNGRHKRQLAFLPFGDLLKQRTEGNNVAQCPCVINPGSNRCIPYDSRYQAASIEEAIVSFPDVSMDPRILEQTSGTPHDGNAFACKTLECQTCAALLSERLRNVGLLSSGDFLGVPLPQFVQPQLCRRFRFTRSLPSPQPPSVTPNFVKEAIEEGLRKLFPTNLFAPNQTPQLALPTLNSAPNLFAQTSVRRTYTISCVERGEAENDDTELLNLCGACWTWRQLPESYFPRLVNELVCKDTPEDYCLSGWGSCNQRYRNIDVLQRVGDSWKPAVISLAAFCDCKVKAGSEIHALVVGKKK